MIGPNPCFISNVENLTLSGNERISRLADGHRSAGGDIAGRSYQRLGEEGKRSTL